MKLGLTYTSKCVVNAENTAIKLGSGTLEVFATPAMVALMENAAYKSVESCLAEGESTVGISADIKHVKASGIGEEITATATLVEVDGRRFVFELKASDSKGLIGEGRHERFVINNEKFLSRL